MYRDPTYLEPSSSFQETYRTATSSPSAPHKNLNAGALHSPNGVEETLRDRKAAPSGRGTCICCVR